METILPKAKQPTFHPLKIVKKEQLTKNTFSLEFEIPSEWQEAFRFEAGQYVSVKFHHGGKTFSKDYSITSAPYEGTIALGIKCNSENSSSEILYKHYNIGDILEVGEPNGRFALISKPAEFRTILGFAAGIGITPILSHFKHILHSEPRSRLFLFYGNKNREEVVFKKELELLKSQYGERLEIHYFYSQEKIGNPLYEGRLDDKRLDLIINQLMMIDDTDEEVTLWDSVDEVLICGKGEMIKSLANACYNNGIPKKNIHFELFETYNDDIYPVETAFPLVEAVNIEFKFNGEVFHTVLPDNRNKILQSLSMQNFKVPFSCKSGICGSCECQLLEGDVELLENEYLTEREESQGKILACMSFALSQNIKIDFDKI